jgi:hypothetical protein
VSLRNNTVEAKVQLKTEELSGSTKYDALLWDTYRFSGEFAFSVDYIKVGVVAAQPLNLDEKLQLRDIDLEVGSVSVTPMGDGGGFVERLVQWSVALVSATVRNLVACVAEEPIRRVIEQSVLADLDLEKLVYDNLPARR